ncbi:MAG: glycosyl transferase, group 1 [Solirubrobacterales bacterium]|nr:glycosyl transferase, group 1 [Solirubrobacterales bacterium]
MLHMILEGAPQSGHDLELVFFHDGPWPAELRDAGLRVDVIEAGRVRQLHRAATTTARLARLLRRRRPDVILNWSAKTQLYGAPAAALAGMSDRVVWWQHSIAGRHWIDLAANLLPARAVACYSSAAAEAQRRLWPRRRTLVIPAGARPVSADAQPAPLRLPEDVPIVGIVGRLQPWKGQDRLLRAQALLAERGHRLHLVIVGGDSYGLSPGYAASLPALIAELGLGDDVTLVGEVADAMPLIERMDVLVNASDPEPFGIVLVEGMAAGVALLAVDAGGPRDIVENGRTGVLARSGAPADLAVALEPLLTSPTLRRSLGAAGRERFMRDYTDDAVRRRFFAALQEIVDELGSSDGDGRER